MSTIASPRDPPQPAPLRRLPSGTPTSSTRPSLDAARSAMASPVANANPSSTAATTAATTAAGAASAAAAAPSSTAKRSKRAALREYYNLGAAPPRLELPDSEVPPSDLDAPDFQAAEYVARVVATAGLGELLRLCARIVGEVRALDAEKKALVYDNYSKLITATETIRKVHPPASKPAPWPCLRR